jgi:hypothetical protein
MRQKTFVKIACIGMAVIGLLLTLFPTILWPCSVTKICYRTGIAIWCETRFPCNYESCTAYETYIICYCDEYLFIIITCDGEVKTPRAPRI